MLFDVRSYTFLTFLCDIMFLGPSVVLQYYFSRNIFYIWTCISKLTIRLIYTLGCMTNEILLSLIFHIWPAIYHQLLLMEFIFHSSFAILGIVHIISIFSSRAKLLTKTTQAVISAVSLEIIFQKIFWSSSSISELLPVVCYIYDWYFCHRACFTQIKCHGMCDRCG